MSLFGWDFVEYNDVVVVVVSIFAVFEDGDLVLGARNSMLLLLLLLSRNEELKKVIRER